MKTRPYGAIGILWMTIACLWIHTTHAERPNVILAMADDMGWRDLSSYGNDRVATPHIDRLAMEGIKLNQYYAASAVCSPTRASVLTGKYPLRFNITKHFSDRGEFLPDCHTLPKLLKSDEINRGTVFWQINLYRSLQRHYPKPKPFATEIARKGKWKLLARDGKPVELFNIESDLYEQNNLLTKQTAIVEELEEELQGWLAAPRRQFGNVPDE